MAKISIIIPIYNSESYLNQCIESIINQTYTNLEIILVNDGSTDNSANICEYYAQKDNRIKVIYQQNQRIGAARNRGLEEATGDWVTFLDSDDYMEINAYEIALNVAMKYTADIIQWDLIFEPEKGCTDIIDNKPVYPYTERICNNEEALAVMFEYKNMDTRFNHLWTVSHCIWPKLYKIDLFRDIRFPINKEYEDEMILHKLFIKASKVIFINERFVHYRLRANSTVHTMNLSGKLDKMDAYRDRMLLCVKLDNEIIHRGIAHDYSIGIMNLYLLAAKQHDKDVMNDLINKAKELLKVLSDSIGLREKILLLSMVYIRSIFLIIYSEYRKRH